MGTGAQARAGQRGAGRQRKRPQHKCILLTESDLQIMNYKLLQALTKDVLSVFHTKYRGTSGQRS